MTILYKMHNEYIDIDIDKIIYNKPENPTGSNSRLIPKNDTGDIITGGYIGRLSQKTSINKKDDDEYIDIDLGDLFIKASVMQESIDYLNGGFSLFSSCKKYQLVENLDDNDELMNSLFPSNIVGSGAYKRVIQLSSSIQNLPSDSEIGYYIEKAIQVAAASGAAVATLGAGGDMLVNLLFTIKHALVMAARIITTINEIVEMITVQHNEPAQEQSDGTAEKSEAVTKVDPDAVRFLSDLLNIDFRDGPNGVECWIKQIFKLYKTDQTNIFVCNILQKIYPSLVEFISNMIGTMVPNAGVVVSSAIVMVMNTNIGKKMAMGRVISMLKKQYKKIPKNLKKMIQDPDLLEKTMTDGFEGLQSVLRDIFKYDEDMPVGEVPVEGEPVEDVPVEDVPVEDVPVEDVPVEDVPVEDVQVEGEQVEGKPIEGGLFIPGYGIMKRVASKTANLTVLPALKGISTLTGLNKLIGPKLRVMDQGISMITKNSRLIAYILHKMLAFTFALLYTLQQCPIS
jgi:hypothetical protein